MTDSRTDHARRPETLPTLAELGHDLTNLTTRQRWLTIVPPFISVMAYVGFAYLGWWIPAVLATAAFTFFSYGSTSHDFVHRNLGLPRWLNETLLSVVELLGLRSGHAYRAAHLHHHQIFPDDDDVEAAAAHMSWFQALLSGPLHQPRVWWWALWNARNDRAWIVFEGIGCIAILICAIALLPVTAAPLIYVILVVMGSWPFPLITAYWPHNPHGIDELSQTRRYRGKVFAVLFNQHLYHLEHHLYPNVPHRHWAALATRLDPYLDRAGVESIYLGF